MVVMKSDTAISIRVGSGNVPPRSLYIDSNIGTMNINIAETITTMIQPTAIGYDIADFTRRRSSSCFSSIVASWSSTMSSIPPTSPERTMAMYTVGKTLGCLETACENDNPRSMSPRIEEMMAASGFDSV